MPANAAHKAVDRVLADPAPVKSPLLMRFVLNLPGIHHLIGRFIGMGIQPQHLRTQDAFTA